MLQESWKKLEIGTIYKTNKLLLCYSNVIIII